VRRLSAAILAALISVGLFAPAAFAASSAAPKAKAVPHVVFIVGPAGAATDGYRAQARAAAAIARRYTPDVVELYSPDATWPAVKDALKGASLVVYMGHGNGWPSRYRDSLYPPTQDGFGLNPTPDGSDSIHQYFGEGVIGTQVKLAKNAVVLLNHLCYASGNSEPGLPEGTLDQARQRVDNYAAGFIQAGASAVIAEAWSSPSYFVKAILGGGRSIQNAWQSSPSANGHRIAFESDRSPGYVAQMDTETRSSGFTRSIVMKAGLAPKDVLAGARGAAPSLAVADLPPAVPLEPTLIGSGLTLGAPDINQLPSAGTAGHVDLLYKIADKKNLPKGIQASARWDPIDAEIAPVDPATEVGGAAPAAGAPAAGAPAAGSTGTPAAGTAGTPTAGSSATGTPAKGSPAKRAPATGTPATGTPAAGTPAAGAAGDPVGGPGVDSAGATNTASAPVAAAAISDPMPKFDAPAASLDLVVPEQLGDVVAPAKVKFGKTAMIVPVTLPSVPGRYRLTIWLHDADGVAFDAATQALIPSLIVRVTGDFDGAIQAASKAQVTAGGKAQLGLRVANLGRTAWGHGGMATPTATIPAQPATVVGRWVPLSVGADASAADTAGLTATTPLPIGIAPGKSVNALLGLTAPLAAGQYLLVLDVVTPERGSLVAAGADPTLVRVTVLPAAPAN
jgi:hypothetical protein